MREWTISPVACSSTKPASGKSSGLDSHSGGIRLSRTPCAEQAPDDPVLALHRVEVAVPVAPADRHPGDEVVEHEVVEHDDAGRASQGVDDPAVRVRVVADVVERDSPCRAGLVSVRGERRVDVERARGARGAAARSSRRSPERSGGIGLKYARPSREEPRDRAVPRHLGGDRLARPPERSRLARGCSRSQRGGAGDARPRRARPTRPVRPSATTSSGPPASVVVITGFSERNASNGTIPKSSSTGA